MVKVQRCDWCTADDLYTRYHDEEWGIPEFDDHALFERLILESMQSGLSWLTVLKKRERMRERFFEFDPGRLARANRSNVECWLKDEGLIRHRGKLEAMVGNARAVLEMDAAFSEFVWSYVGVPVQNRWRRSAEVPPMTETSKRMARTLKNCGFSFVGPTTCYAFMQSAGLVNDHLVSCFAHDECARVGRE
ncbi:MAG: DNA-3-methyladenine glycosylase I [Pseudomonadales bacterium]|jgi:DNA-3-methyladenine glycosylase I|nr:DNA-3-methyladenine glycosylase I [Pseudomonadales bacterium]MDP6471431.1 DNA-3-methyladenine glycosylase I [Pseudomonadales bacterium]MDP6828600.1 DNA-3-methyladenine glycosylase I [Pseudomonadales bacterium]MDP6973217.1 DNA-3-methyladenine glycosylase I [Pseudomonadales bacterium]|tara:strand:+ start:1382 stop:1954 length:573 start_codon:yes stop_codon:yes gene_type:complete